MADQDSLTPTSAVTPPLADSQTPKAAPHLPEPFPGQVPQGPVPTIGPQLDASGAPDLSTTFTPTYDKLGMEDAGAQAWMQTPAEPAAPGEVAPQKVLGTPVPGKNVVGYVPPPRPQFHPIDLHNNELDRKNTAFVYGPNGIGNAPLPPQIQNLMEQGVDLAQLEATRRMLGRLAIQEPRGDITNVWTQWDPINKRKNLIYGFEGMSRPEAEQFWLSAYRAIDRAGLTAEMQNLAYNQFLTAGVGLPVAQALHAASQTPVTTQAPPVTDAASAIQAAAAQVAIPAEKAVRTLAGALTSWVPAYTETLDTYMNRLNESGSIVTKPYLGIPHVEAAFPDGLPLIGKGTALDLSGLALFLNKGAPLNQALKFGSRVMSNAAMGTSSRAATSLLAGLDEQVLRDAEVRRLARAADDALARVGGVYDGKQALIPQALLGPAETLERTKLKEGLLSDVRTNLQNLKARVLEIAKADPNWTLRSADNLKLFDPTPGLIESKFGTAATTALPRLTHGLAFGAYGGVQAGASALAAGESGDRARHAALEGFIGGVATDALFKTAGEGLAAAGEAVRAPSFLREAFKGIDLADKWDNLPEAKPAPRILGEAPEGERHPTPVILGATQLMDLHARAAAGDPEAAALVAQHSLPDPAGVSLDARNLGSADPHTTTLARDHAALGQPAHVGDLLIDHDGALPGDLTHLPIYQVDGLLWAFPDEGSAVCLSDPGGFAQLGIPSDAETHFFKDSTSPVDWDFRRGEEPSDVGFEHSAAGTLARSDQRRLQLSRLTGQTLPEHESPLALYQRIASPEMLTPETVSGFRDALATQRQQLTQYHAAIPELAQATAGAGAPADEVRHVEQQLLFHWAEQNFIWNEARQRVDAHERLLARDATTPPEEAAAPLDKPRPLYEPAEARDAATRRRELVRQMEELGADPADVSASFADILKFEDENGVVPEPSVALRPAEREQLALHTRNRAAGLAALGLTEEAERAAELADRYENPEWTDPESLQPRKLIETPEETAAARQRTRIAVHSSLGAALNDLEARAARGEIKATPQELQIVRAYAATLRAHGMTDDFTVHLLRTNEGREAKARIDGRILQVFLDTIQQDHTPGELQRVLTHELTHAVNDALPAELRKKIRAECREACDAFIGAHPWFRTVLSRMTPDRMLDEVTARELLKDPQFASDSPKFGFDITEVSPGRWQIYFGDTYRLVNEREWLARAGESVVPQAAERRFSTSLTDAIRAHVKWLALRAADTLRRWTGQQNTMSTLRDVLSGRVQLAEPQLADEPAGAVSPEEQTVNEARGRDPEEAAYSDIANSLEGTWAGREVPELAGAGDFAEAKPRPTKLTKLRSAHAELEKEYDRLTDELHGVPESDPRWAQRDELETRVAAAADAISAETARLAVREAKSAKPAQAESESVAEGAAPRSIPTPENIMVANALRAFSDPTTHFSTRAAALRRLGNSAEKLAQLRAAGLISLREIPAGEPARKTDITIDGVRYDARMNAISVTPAGEKLISDLDTHVPTPPQDPPGLIPEFEEASPAPTAAEPAKPAPVEPPNPLAGVGKGPKKPDPQLLIGSNRMTKEAFSELSPEERILHYKTRLNGVLSAHIPAPGSGKTLSPESFAGIFAHLTKAKLTVDANGVVTDGPKYARGWQLTPQEAAALDSHWSDIHERIRRLVPAFEKLVAARQETEPPQQRGAPQPLDYAEWLDLARMLVNDPSSAAGWSAKDYAAMLKQSTPLRAQQALTETLNKNSAAYKASPAEIREMSDKAESILNSIFDAAVGDAASESDTIMNRVLLDNLDAHGFILRGIGRGLRTIRDFRRAVNTFDMFLTQRPQTEFMGDNRNPLTQFAASHTAELTRNMFQLVSGDAHSGALGMELALNSLHNRLRPLYAFLDFNPALSDAKHFADEFYAGINGGRSDEALRRQSLTINRRVAAALNLPAGTRTTTMLDFVNTYREIMRDVMSRASRGKQDSLLTDIVRQRSNVFTVRKHLLDVLSQNLGQSADTLRSWHDALTADAADLTAKLADQSLAPEDRATYQQWSDSTNALLAYLNSFAGTKLPAEVASVTGMTALLAPALTSDNLPELKKWLREGRWTRLAAITKTPKELFNHLADQIDAHDGYTRERTRWQLIDKWLADPMNDDALAAAVKAGAKIRKHYSPFVNMTQLFTDDVERDMKDNWHETSRVGRNFANGFLNHRANDDFYRKNLAEALSVYLPTMLRTAYLEPRLKLAEQKMAELPGMQQDMFKKWTELLRGRRDWLGAYIQEQQTKSLQKLAEDNGLNPMNPQHLLQLANTPEGRKMLRRGGNVAAFFNTLNTATFLARVNPAKVAFYHALENLYVPAYLMATNTHAPLSWGGFKQFMSQAAHVAPNLATGIFKGTAAAASDFAQLWRERAQGAGEIIGRAGSAAPAATGLPELGQALLSGTQRYPIGGLPVTDPRTLISSARDLNDLNEYEIRRTYKLGRGKEFQGQLDRASHMFWNLGYFFPAMASLWSRHVAFETFKNDARRLDRNMLDVREGASGGYEVFDRNSGRTQSTHASESDAITAMRERIEDESNAYAKNQVDLIYSDYGKRGQNPYTRFPGAPFFFQFRRWGLNRMGLHSELLDTAMKVKQHGAARALAGWMPGTWADSLTDMAADTLAYRQQQAPEPGAGLRRAASAATYGNDQTRPFSSARPTYTSDAQLDFLDKAPDSWTPEEKNRLAYLLSGIESTRGMQPSDQLINAARWQLLTTGMIPLGLGAAGLKLGHGLFHAIPNPFINGMNTANMSQISSVAQLTSMLAQQSYAGTPENKRRELEKTADDVASGFLPFSWLIRDWRREELAQAYAIRGTLHSTQINAALADYKKKFFPEYPGGAAGLLYPAQIFTNYLKDFPPALVDRTQQMSGRHGAWRFVIPPNFEQAARTDLDNLKRLVTGQPLKRHPTEVPELGAKPLPTSPIGAARYIEAERRWESPLARALRGLGGEKKAKPAPAEPGPAPAPAAPRSTWQWHRKGSK